jgi:diketogulonate reductase-like aldo/keto reductase
MKMIQLRSGHSVPQLGLGTWQLEGDACVESVARAIELGYRHIDTAFGYSNHRQVGEGVRRSGIDRGELFITTKIPPRKQNRSQVIEQGRMLQEELGIEYLDLLLIHWPDKKVTFTETLGAMGELVDRGVVRSIGVSNFNARITAEADEVSVKPIVTNQVEFHPMLYQKELLEACLKREIRITAYSPLAQGAVMSNDRLVKIAEAHGATAAQVAISWLIAKGTIVIPKATSETHLRSNIEAVDLELSPEEIASIDSIEERKRCIGGSWADYPLE